MKNTKFITVFLSFLFSIFVTYGQFGDSYIQTDSLYRQLPVIDQGAVKNALECYADHGHKKIRYSPDELRGYGLENGKTYVSKTIQLGDSFRKVFLEVLEAGDYSLYCYHEKNGKHLFIAHGDTLIFELSKKTYKDRLKEWSYTDYPELKNDINLVRYNKHSLKKFVKKYNSKDLSPLPFPKVGLMVGNEMVKFNLKTNLLMASDYFRYDYKSSFMVGAFLDYPILSSDFSAHLEIYYSHHSYAYNRMTQNEYLSLDVTAPDLTRIIHLDI